LSIHPSTHISSFPLLSIISLSSINDKLSVIRVLN
jgi:hypothetical protein